MLLKHFVARRGDGAPVRIFDGMCTDSPVPAARLERLMEVFGECALGRRVAGADKLYPCADGGGLVAVRLRAGWLCTGGHRRQGYISLTLLLGGCRRISGQRNFDRLGACPMLQLRSPRLPSSLCQRGMMRLV